MGTACVVFRIYDQVRQDLPVCADLRQLTPSVATQSPRHNHLGVAPGGTHVPAADRPVNASRLPITVRGNHVYGAFFEGAQGYRNDSTTGVATGNEPEVRATVSSLQ